MRPIGTADAWGYLGGQRIFFGGVFGTAKHEVIVVVGFAGEIAVARLGTAFVFRGGLEIERHTQRRAFAVLDELVAGLVPFLFLWAFEFRDLGNRHRPDVCLIWQIGAVFGEVEQQIDAEACPRAIGKAGCVAAVLCLARTRIDRTKRHLRVSPASGERYYMYCRLAQKCPFWCKNKPVLEY